MDIYDFPDLTTDTSFYDHQPQSTSDNSYYDFVTANIALPNSMVRSTANATSRSQDQSFPPVDSILYSPLDDWAQISDYSAPDSFGLQNLFSESPLMSTLERQSTTASTSNKTRSPDTSSLSTSPPHEHVDVAGWEPTPESKRSRPENDKDSKSACWTSPLCPAFGKPGPHPNPSNCEGGCAANMFDDHSMDQWFENLSKSKDGAGLLETPISSSMVDTLDASAALLGSDSKNDLISVKEEELMEEVPLRPRQKGRSNKRASSEESMTTSPDPVPTKATSAGKPSRRQPHNEIEKKYRESINTHLEALKNSLPAFQQSKTQCLQGKGDIEDLAATPKPSKSIILASAVAHIKKIEKEKRQFEQERNMLRQQVKALQALVKCDDCSLMQYIVGLNSLNLGNNPHSGCSGRPRM
jgi:hypothetical protein